MAKTTSKDTPGLLDQAKADLSSSTKYQQKYKDKWGLAWKLWHNERINIGYHSQSGVDSFDPMTYNNVETNIANQFGSKPRIMYLPTKLEQAKETRVLNQMVHYTWDKNDLSLEIISAGRELQITGNFVFFDTWDHETDWIKTTRVSINDCVFDPNAHNKASLRFGGYRYLTMLDELEDVEMLDSDGKWGKKYKNLDKIDTWSDGKDEDLDRQLKDAYEGSTLDSVAKTGQVEVALLYYVKGKYKGKVIDLANRSTIIFEGDSQFQKAKESRKVHCAQFNKDGTPILEPDTNQDGTPNPKAGDPIFKLEMQDIPEIKPFIPCWIQRDTIDGQQFYGMGQVEPNADNQELLNDTITQKRDNVTVNLNNMILIDPKFKDMVTKIKNVPNAVYAIPPGAIEFVQKPDMTNAADLEIARLKESMRTTSAIDEVTSGLAPEHQSTATQINSQLGQFDKRTTIKLQGLENEGFKQMSDNWYKMFRIFVTKKEVIRITGRKGVDFLTLDPDMYWGEYEPQVTLDMNAKAARDDEIKRIEGVANILMNNPYVDQKELTRVITTRLLEFDDDEAETLMVKDSDMQPQQAPPQAGQAPGMPQGQMPQGMAAQPQGPQVQGIPNMPNGQMPANPAAMAALLKASGSPADNQGPKTIQERIVETIDYNDLPEDAKQQVLSQQLGIDSSMASPAQQNINMQGMKLQHEQHKLDLAHAQHSLSTSQAQHDALLKQHEALLKTHAAGQAAQNQEFTQGHQTAEQKFNQNQASKQPAGK